MNQIAINPTLALYWKLIRGNNILIIGVNMLFLYFLLEGASTSPTSLFLSELFAFIFGSMCIAASGNVINDLFDQKADAVNKPDKRIIGVSISEHEGMNFYVFLVALGVLIPALYAWIWGLWMLCIAVVLYFYSKTFKHKGIWGNLTIATLCGLLNWQMGWIEQQSLISYILLLYFTLFAFCTTFLREFVKDIEDEKGDRLAGSQTYVVQFGTERAIEQAEKWTKILLSINFFAIMIVAFRTDSAMLFFTGMLTLGMKGFIITRFQEIGRIKYMSTYYKYLILIGVGQIFLVSIFSF
jgi:4-hydroxybenzoate polyprenyltransferase